MGGQNRESVTLLLEYAHLQSPVLSPQSYKVLGKPSKSKVQGAQDFWALIGCQTPTRSFSPVSYFKCSMNKHIQAYTHSQKYTYRHTETHTCTHIPQSLSFLAHPEAVVDYIMSIIQLVCIRHWGASALCCRPFSVQFLALKYRQL